MDLGRSVERSDQRFGGYFVSAMEREAFSCCEVPRNIDAAH